MDRINELLDLARQAREQAYAPYSRYAVGAALLADTGEVYSGCNVENASYGATICAERVAVTNAVSHGKRRFIAVAIVSGSQEPSPPCGICRQVLAEFSPDIRIIMGNLSGKVVDTTLDRLLPGAFAKSFMDK